MYKIVSEDCLGTVIIISNPTAIEVVLSCIEVVVGVLTISENVDNIRGLGVSRGTKIRFREMFWSRKISHIQKENARNNISR